MSTPTETQTPRERTWIYITVCIVLIIWRPWRPHCALFTFIITTCCGPWRAYYVAITLLLLLLCGLVSIPLC